VELLLLDYMSGAVPFLVVVVLCQLVLRSLRGEAGPAKAGSLVEQFRNGNGNGHVHGNVNGNGNSPDLTRREGEVLALLALGHTNKEVAAELCLSVRTVESHRARIQQKLDLSGRAELLRYALERDLVRWPSEAAASDPA
jgi:DNA-binding CsgD family transcriptional regulator